jgi:hypothetical protein
MGQRRRDGGHQIRPTMSPRRCCVVHARKKKFLLLLDHEAVRAWLGSRWLPSWADLVSFGLVRSSPYFYVMLCYVFFFFFFYFLF